MISKEKYKDMKNTQMLYKSVNDFAHDYRVSWYIANKVWNSKSYKDYSTKKEPKKVAVIFDKPTQTKYIKKDQNITEALLEYMKFAGDWMTEIDFRLEKTTQEVGEVNSILVASVNKTSDMNTRLVEMERERTLQKWFNLLVAILASTALVISIIG